MTLDDIKLYLPKFLSPTSEDQLFEGLKGFPSNIDSRIYTTALNDSPFIFQGDGLNDMLIINLPNESIVPAKSMVLSNSCDINPANARNFTSNIAYAPIFDLNKYKQSLIARSGKSRTSIDSHINEIKKQRITQIFYLPKIEGIIDDSIVFFDKINHCDPEYVLSKNLQTERLFTLSDYGVYLFIYKFSIHSTRMLDKVDRLAGVY